MIGYYNYTVILTYLGLASAVTGIMLLQADVGGVMLAIGLLFFAGICDMFDGRVARTMKRDSMQENFGVQIDSLSDLICFGLFPACIIHKMGLSQPYFVPILVLFVLCGLVRLAYFNVRAIEKKYNPQTNIGNYFIGMPITSSFIIVPILYCVKPYFTMVGTERAYSIFLAIATTLCSIFFISPVKVSKPDKRGLIFMIFLSVVILVTMILSYIFLNEFYT